MFFFIYLPVAFLLALFSIFGFFFFYHLERQNLSRYQEIRDYADRTPSVHCLFLFILMSGADIDNSGEDSLDAYFVSLLITVFWPIVFALIVLYLSGKVIFKNVSHSVEKFVQIIYSDEE